MMTGESLSDLYKSPSPDLSAQLSSPIDSSSGTGGLTNGGVEGGNGGGVVPGGSQDSQMGRLAGKYGLGQRLRSVDVNNKIIGSSHVIGGDGASTTTMATARSRGAGVSQPQLERKYGSDRHINRDLTRSAIEEVRHRLEMTGDRAKLGLKVRDLKESSGGGGIAVPHLVSSPISARLETSSEASTPSTRSGSYGGGMTEEGEGGGNRSISGISPRSLGSIPSPSSVSSFYDANKEGAERVGDGAERGGLSPAMDWQMMLGIERLIELGLGAQQSPRFPERIMEMAAAAAMRDGGYLDKEGGREQRDVDLLAAGGSGGGAEMMKNSETATRQWRKSISSIADYKKESGWVAGTTPSLSSKSVSMPKNMSFGRLERTERLKGYGSEDAAREAEERSRRMEVYRPHGYDRINTEVTITLTGLVNIDRKDSLGRTIVVIDASFIPPPRLRFAAVALMRERMDAIVQEPYVLVFVMTPKNRHKAPSTKVPAWWCLKVYHNLPRPYKKNVQRVVFIHPTLWFTMILNVMKPFFSAKVFRKFVRANTLSDIEREVGDEIKLSQIALAPHVFVHDKKGGSNITFIKDVKQVFMNSPLAAMAAKAAARVTGPSASSVAIAPTASQPIPQSSAISVGGGIGGRTPQSSAPQINYVADPASATGRMGTAAGGTRSGQGTVSNEERGGELPRNSSSITGLSSSPSLPPTNSSFAGPVTASSAHLAHLPIGSISSPPFKSAVPTSPPQILVNRAAGLDETEPAQSAAAADDDSVRDLQRSFSSKS